MTTLLIKITEANTTKELHRLLYDNLKWYNGSEILDYAARMRRRELRKLTENVCKN
jgi:hypothetical protein